MSDKIPVTLKKADGTVLEEKPPVSLGDKYCKFPFNYKGKEYNKCVKKGDDLICATSLSKSGKLKTYAICKTKKKAVKGPSPENNAGATNNSAGKTKKVKSK